MWAEPTMRDTPAPVSPPASVNTPPVTQAPEAPPLTHLLLQRAVSQGLHEEHVGHEGQVQAHLWVREKRVGMEWRWSEVQGQEEASMVASGKMRGCWHADQPHPCPGLMLVCKWNQHQQGATLTAPSSFMSSTPTPGSLEKRLMAASRSACFMSVSGK